MLASILRSLLVTSIALLAGLIWLVLVLSVNRDARRRVLPASDRWFWVALAIVLPVVGFFVYLVGKGIARLITPHGSTIYGDGLGDPAGLPAYPAAYAGRSPRGLTNEARQTTDEVLVTQTGAHDVHLSGTQPGAPASTPAGMPAGEVLSVQVIAGPAVGRVFSASELPARIGRAADCAVRLEPDRSVSRHHADLYRGAGGIHVRDLGSLSGTWVNGARVEDQALLPGDRVAVGESVLQVIRISVR